VTSTTQTVFGNLDRRDYFVQTVAFPMKLDLCVKEILQVFAEPIQRLPIEAACIGFAEDGCLTLMSKEHSSERSKKTVPPPAVAATVLPAAVAAAVLPAAVAARGKFKWEHYVIAILSFLLVVFVPWGAIIATCSQSVGTARHSISGFMAWGNTTATRPPPVFGPHEDPNTCNGGNTGPDAQETFNNTTKGPGNNTTKGSGAKEQHKNATGGASKGTGEQTDPPHEQDAGGAPPGPDAGGRGQGTEGQTVRGFLQHAKGNISALLYAAVDEYAKGNISSLLYAAVDGPGAIIYKSLSP